MRQYAYTPVNGHVVAEIDDRRFLLDTGLPISMADRPVELDGKLLEVDSKVMGLTVEDLTGVVGIELDGLLGGNLSEEFIVKIHPRERNIVLDRYLDEYPIGIEVEDMGGIPVMYQTINGRLLRAFLNLGSNLSYVKADMVAGLEPVGRATDVFHFLGAQEVDIYSLSVQIDRRALDFRFGVVPEELESWMDMANIQAAIGSQLLDHYALSLSLAEGSLMLDPLH